MKKTLLVFINLTVFCLCFSFHSMGQENEKAFGLELGVGANELVSVIDLTEIPNNNIAGYFGVLGSYRPKGAFLSFETGLRYQRKGDNFNAERELKLDYLLVPLELRFQFFRKKPIQFFFKSGVAPEINLNKSNEELDINRLAFNFRGGLGISVKINEEYDFLLQYMRTVSLGTYTGYGYSLGGNQYIENYSNSGVGIGVQIFKKIGK